MSSVAKPKTFSVLSILRPMKTKSSGEADARDDLRVHEGDVRERS